MRIDVRRLVTLAMLVVLADLLFFDRSPGLSLAVFAALLAIVVRLGCGPRRVVTGDLATAALLVLAVLPVVELVQGLSLLFLALGLVAATVRIGLGSGGTPRGLARGMMIFVQSFPAVSASGALGGSRWAARSGRDATPLRSLARTWLLPGAAGLVLVALLLAANPILSLWAAELGDLPLHPKAALRHVMFWIVAGLLLWPFVALAADRRWLGRTNLTSVVPTTTAWPVWVNETSIRNSLVLFNLLLGVQTLLDLGYLWGGIELPDGVTPAQYAHRGAYPLVATALLAGAFALVSRSFVYGRGWLRLLLGLWIAQNILLVISALLRLDLYVDAFGFTRLRLAAGIWMALVAGGLVLTAWQIWGGRSNGWLLGRVAVMAGLVLYLCCFLNVAHVVARVNLDRFERMGALDRDYLCNLGPGAGPAIRTFEARSGADLCDMVWHRSLMAPAPQDWRDWGFRNWRLRRYVEAARASQESSR
jgi:hypothetical protein